MQDQDPRSGRVVQLRPRGLDLLQLPERLAAEVLNGELVVGFVGVYTELPVEGPPSEMLGVAEAKEPVDEPQVEIGCFIRELLLIVSQCLLNS